MNVKLLLLFHLWLFFPYLFPLHFFLWYIFFVDFLFGTSSLCFSSFPHGYKYFVVCVYSLLVCRCMCLFLASFYPSPFFISFHLFLYSIFLFFTCFFQESLQHLLLLFEKGDDGCLLLLLHHHLLLLELVLLLHLLLL